MSDRDPAIEAAYEIIQAETVPRSTTDKSPWQIAEAAIAAYEESGQDEARVEVKKEGRKPRTEAKPESIEETRSPDRSTDENEDARVERVAKAIAANDDWEVLDKDKYRRQARAAIAAYEESGQDEARCLDELQRRIESLRIDEADMGDLADEAVAANEMLDAVLVVLQSAESGQFSSSTPQCPDCGFPPDENGNPLCPPSCSVRALDETTAEPSAVTTNPEPSPDQRSQLCVKHGALGCDDCRPSSDPEEDEEEKSAMPIEEQCQIQLAVLGDVITEAMDLMPWDRIQRRITFAANLACEMEGVPPVVPVNQVVVDREDLGALTQFVLHLPGCASKCDCASGRLRKALNEGGQG